MAVKQIPGVDYNTALSALRSGGQVVGSDGYLYTMTVTGGGANPTQFRAIGKAPAGAKVGATMGSSGGTGGTVQNYGTPETIDNRNSTTKATKVVPGTAGKGEINVVDYSGKQAINPTLTESEKLSNRVPNIDENAAGTNLDPSNPNYAKPDGPDAQTGQVANTAQASQVAPKTAQTYEAETSADKVAAQDMQAAQGTVDPRAQVEAPQIDMKGTATGVNEDGSVNYTGQALNDYAQQDLNAVDPKATLKGQLGLLQDEFVNPQTGQPQIPTWAAGTAREVSRIAAFKGMTGTASVAAMSQALHEASITVAQQDAQFFQTLTLQNLSNKQASIINKANVLAKMDEVNADNRMAAAIQNSKNFMDMSLANLNNEQQARVINTQNRVQSILEDTKAINAARMFGAEQANDFAKFYDGLSAQIDQFNATQTNQMAQFNTSEFNAQQRFNAELENSRQEFYKTMQYNVDLANAKWRQTVTLTEADMKFNAAAMDVKNLVGIQQEALNQIWDRSDALLDYIWKSSENEKNRQAELGMYKMGLDAKDEEGWGSLLGSIAGGLFSGGSSTSIIGKLLF